MSVRVPLFVPVVYYEFGEALQQLGSLGALGGVDDVGCGVEQDVCNGRWPSAADEAPALSVGADDSDRLIVRAVAADSAVGRGLA